MADRCHVRGSFSRRDPKHHNTGSLPSERRTKLLRNPSLTAGKKRGGVRTAPRIGGRGNLFSEPSRGDENTSSAGFPIEDVKTGWREAFAAAASEAAKGSMSTLELVRKISSDAFHQYLSIDSRLCETNIRRRGWPGIRFVFTRACIRGGGFDYMCPIDKLPVKPDLSESQYMSIADMRIEEILPLVTHSFAETFSAKITELIEGGHTAEQALDFVFPEGVGMKKSSKFHRNDTLFFETGYKLLYKLMPPPYLEIVRRGGLLSETDLALAEKCWPLTSIQDFLRRSHVTFDTYAPNWPGGSARVRASVQTLPAPEAVQGRAYMGIPDEVFDGSLTAVFFMTSSELQSVAEESILLDMAKYYVDEEKMPYEWGGADNTRNRLLIVEKKRAALGYATNKLRPKLQAAYKEIEESCAGGGASAGVWEGLSLPDPPSFHSYSSHDNAVRLALVFLQGTPPRDGDQGHRDFMDSTLNWTYLVQLSTKSVKVGITYWYTLGLRFQAHLRHELFLPSSLSIGVAFARRLQSLLVEQSCQVLAAWFGRVPAGSLATKSIAGESIDWGGDGGVRLPTPGHTAGRPAPWTGRPCPGRPCPGRPCPPGLWERSRFEPLSVR